MKPNKPTQEEEEKRADEERAFWGKLFRDIMNGIPFGKGESGV